MSTVVFSKGAIDSFKGVSTNTSSDSFVLNEAVDRTYSYSADYIPDALSRLEELNIRIKDKESIKKFLGRHPRMIPYLYEIPDHMNSLKSSSTFLLREFSDSEIEGRLSQELLLVIRSRLRIDEAKSKIDRIRKEWLFRIPEKEMSKLSLVLQMDHGI